MYDHRGGIKGGGSMSLCVSRGGHEVCVGACRWAAGCRGVAGCFLMGTPLTALGLLTGNGLAGGLVG